MKELKETKTDAYTAGATTQPPAKEPYVKPQIEVIKLELEQPILVGSFDPWGPGGW